MNIKIGKITKRDLVIYNLIIYLALVFIILKEQIFHINYPIIFNCNNTIASVLFTTFGAFVVITLWVAKYCLERKKEKEFKKVIGKRLNYELDVNLKLINDNIYIIKYKRPTKELSLIQNLILMSLINTLKISMIPKGAVDYLLIYQTQTINVNNTLRVRNFKLALRCLIIARKHLIISFKYLGIKHKERKYLLKGKRYQLKSQDIK